MKREIIISKWYNCRGIGKKTELSFKVRSEACQNSARLKRENFWCALSFRADKIKANSSACASFFVERFAGFNFNYRREQKNFAPQNNCSSFATSSFPHSPLFSIEFHLASSLSCVSFLKVLNFSRNLFHQLRKHFWLKTSPVRGRSTKRTFLMTRLKDVMKAFLSFSSRPSAELEHVSWLFGFVFMWKIPSLYERARDSRLGLGGREKSVFG